MKLNPYFYDFDIYQSPDGDIPAERFIGNNAKKLLVVVKESDFTKENKNFLSKVLGAVKFNMLEDTLVLTMPDEKQYAINSLISGSKCTTALIFGFNPKEIGISIETFLYAPFTISSNSLLIGHQLEKIKASTEYKKTLWGALQKLFPST